MKKGFYILLGTMIIMIVVVAALLIFTQRAGAATSPATTCGLPIGQAADMLALLDDYDVPYMLGVTAAEYNNRTVCTGWVIKVGDAMLLYNTDGSYRGMR